MSLWSGLRSAFAPLGEPASDPPPRRVIVGTTTRARRTFDSPNQGFLGQALALAAPLAPDDEWRMEQLDADALSRVSPYRLIELLADLSPEVSRAIWDFLRMCNPGWTADAIRPSGKPAPTAATLALQNLLGVLNARHGSVNIPLNRLYIGAYLRGGFFSELILDQAGRQMLDLATPDPRAAQFRQVADPDLGTRWQLGQYQGGQWVPLDYPTIRYLPIDPFPGKPHGRSPANPALFPTLFAIAMLHDTRRVVQQQGYPRLDLAIDFAALQNSLPDPQRDPDGYRTAVQAVITDVIDAYSGLEPDDAYVHSKDITVNKPVGAVDASSLKGIEGLIAVLERQAVRALKSMPLLMGMADGVSEANAARQWEIHVAGIKAIQQLCEGMLEHQLGLALEAQGIAAGVRFRFAELRSAELLRDEQFKQLQITNNREMYAAGWIDQDEAAQTVTGHAAAEPEPRSGGTAPATTSPDAAAINPEPGSKA